MQHEPRCLPARLRGACTHLHSTLRPLCRPCLRPMLLLLHPVGPHPPIRRPPSPPCRPSANATTRVPLSADVPVIFNSLGSGKSASLLNTVIIGPCLAGCCSTRLALPLVVSQHRGGCCWVLRYVGAPLGVAH